MRPVGKTAISWTDMTWNPVSGCSHVSEGCRHCYAEAVSLRYRHTTKPWTAQNVAHNVITHADRLEAPLQWQRPRKIFVNSMSDLFHEHVPDDFIDQVFEVMAQASRHTFQVLTKRPQRMLDYVTKTERINYVAWPLPNVWLGVSAEDQAWWDERVEILGRVPAAVRFVSAEPLLGNIDVGNSFDPAPDDSPYGALHWVIIGGESGPHHRPMDPAWADWLAKQCVLAGIPCFVKQDSGHWPGHQGRLSDALWALKEFPM